MSLLMGAIFAMSFTSCSDDNGSNPTVTQPTEFIINASPLAEQYIQLSADNMVNLTWSQPNYGFNALATYQIQVGLVEGGNVTWNTKDGAPKYLKTTYTSCNANISGEDSLSDPQEIERVLGKQLDMVVDGGILRGEPSSVISLVGDQVEVLREGGGDISWITRE